MTALEVRHVGKRFGSVEALRDVSMHVPAGSMFGFLGPNGAGKTTLLRGLVGLMRFSTGGATVLGMDPWRERVALHARIGYLPSGMGMYAGMTGEQVLDYAASLTPSDGARSPLRAEALDALALTAADLARPVADYSKGMRQKLAIAQAVQHDPELLLMDEPSEGLDPLVQHGVYELLRARVREGRTILFSSHTLSEVEALCDRVAIIRHGTLVAEATLDELRSQRSRIVRIVPADPADLQRLDPSFEPHGVDHAGRSVFHVRADATHLLGALATISLLDVLIEEPSLEDIFRSYYADDAADTTDIAGMAGTEAAR